MSLSRIEDLDPASGATGLPTDDAYVPHPSRESIAWAAGFADGEACLCIAKPTLRPGRRSPNYRLSFTIDQNHRGVLEHFRRVVGVPARIYRTKREDYHRHQCYRLIYTDRAALEVSRILAPYFVRKDREADAVARYWIEGRCGLKGGRPLSPEILAIREHYYQLMRDIK